MISTLTNIAALVERDGEITLGHLDAIGKCAATATDGAQCLAMLVRRKGESLDALLRRLDAAIVDAYVVSSSDRSQPVMVHLDLVEVGERLLDVLAAIVATSPARAGGCSPAVP